MSNKTYQEEGEGTFQSNGKYYDLNTIFKLTEHLDVETISIDKLIWILEFDKGDSDKKQELKRIKLADITVPILVTLENKREVVVDGIHRLRKGIELGEKQLPYKRVTEDMLKKAELKYKEENLVSKPPAFVSW